MSLESNGQDAAMLRVVWTAYIVLLAGDRIGRAWVVQAATACKAPPDGDRTITGVATFDLYAGGVQDEDQRDSEFNPSPPRMLSAEGDATPTSAHRA